MVDFSRTTKSELIELKEHLILDAFKNKKEIEDIDQELKIRTLPDCRPLCDILKEGAS